MQQKKIFITGANGFIGRHLQEQLSKNYNVHAPSRQDLNLLHADDVTDYMNQHHFDIVIHSATQNASRNAKEPLDLVLDHNLRMFFNLAQHADKFGKMIVLGSGAEYDMRHYQPLMPESYFNQHVPVDGYGFSKYVMSRFAEAVDNIYVLRIFGCFGPYEDWEIRFISNAICKTLFDLPITIRQNVFFDFLYIDDFVHIMRWFIENTPKHKHYNTCSGRSIDLLSIADIVHNIAGKPELPVIVKQPGFKPEYSGGNARMIQEMGQFDFTTNEAAIRKLYQWYQQNSVMIEPKKLFVDK